MAYESEKIDDAPKSGKEDPWLKELRKQQVSNTDFIQANIDKVQEWPDQHQEKLFKIRAMSS